MFCPKCGNENPDSAQFCLSCGAPTANGGVETPLNWAKFLGYFALWLSAVLNLITGIVTMTGSQYDGLSTMVYAMFPGMKTIDIIYGLLCIGIAAVAAYSALGIIKRKKYVIKMIPELYSGVSIMVLLYVILASVITSINVVTTSTVINIFVSAVMAIVNSIYFKKREHIFVN